MGLPETSNFPQLLVPEPDLLGSVKDRRTRVYIRIRHILKAEEDLITCTTVQKEEVDHCTLLPLRVHCHISETVVAKWSRHVGSSLFGRPGADCVAGNVLVQAFPEHPILERASMSRLEFMMLHIIMLSTLRNMSGSNSFQR
jgi:hypothetical protein